MTESTPPAASNDPIVARFGAYYRNTRYTLTLILFIMAGWFAYDGWVKYPAQNRQHAELEAKIKAAESSGQDVVQLREQLRDIDTHSDLDIFWQHALAVLLPLLGMALSGWAIYNSRGEIKLSGERLSAPGHPEIGFDDIDALDQRLWDRKDIAYVRYEKGVHKGSIRLDAFVYEADPIVKIYERIEAYMKAHAETPETHPGR